MATERVAFGPSFMTFRQDFDTRKESLAVNQLLLCVGVYRMCFGRLARLAGDSRAG